MQRIEKLIFAQANRTPDDVAVEYKGARLNYRELKSQALEISQALKNSGLAIGETVGIFQHRSLTTLPLVLGIWDAGGVVVPINPAMPVKMLESVIQDSSPSVILAEPDLRPRIAQAIDNINLISSPQLVTGYPRSNGHSPHNRKFRQSARRVIKDNCYIIYTSGSEGRPKGVVGSHRSLIQYLRWQVKEFAVTKADRFSQTKPLSFDFSLKELFVPLLCGARLYRRYEHCDGCAEIRRVGSRKRNYGYVLLAHVVAFDSTVAEIAVGCRTLSICARAADFGRHAQVAGCKRLARAFWQLDSAIQSLWSNRVDRNQVVLSNS